MRRGTAVPDIDSIELYEWACQSIQEPNDYADTFGVLRLRWVKANPRNPGALQCLQRCIQSWDLVNAQQVCLHDYMSMGCCIDIYPLKIAILIDKSSPNSNDRRLMFWSITLTYLLSVGHLLFSANDMYLTSMYCRSAHSVPVENKSYTVSLRLSSLKEPLILQRR